MESIIRVACASANDSDKGEVRRERGGLCGCAGHEGVYSGQERWVEEWRVTKVDWGHDRF